MKKPIVLAVDDDADVLQALAHDLRRHYGEQYRVVRATSGAEALDAVRQIKLANDVIALILSDQRMPQMTGDEFLSQSIGFFPVAKRVLLTAYADTEVAIRAINDVQLDYYLMKPWDPPEERLFPVLDDLLSDWQAHYRPEFEGLRVIGHRWSQEAHEIRDFLARNQFPHRWMDLDKDPAAGELLLLTGETPASVPVLIFEDGSVMVKPSTADLAERIGLRRQVDLPLYDLVIIGGGPAGLAASVYGASEGLKTLVIERRAVGGQAGMSSKIENYLGFPSGLSGDDLARRAITQAQRLGAEFLLTHDVAGIRVEEGSIGILLEDDSEIRARNVIVATGVRYKLLDVPGAEQLNGTGIYYGAANSEAGAVTGEDVYVVGGANSAGQAAMHLSGFARKVTMLVRGPSLSATMSSYLVDRILATENIDVLYGTSVKAVQGEDKLESITVVDKESGIDAVLPAGSMFVFIGAEPATNWMSSMVCCDDRGFVLTGPDVLTAAGTSWKLDRDPVLLETSLPGVFAAGDVRHGSGKRVATAVGEGAMAVMSVWQHRALSGL